VSFERAAGDVRAAGVFDGDEVVAWRRRAVRELVTLVDLTTTQLDLRRTVNGHRQRSRPGVDGIDDESTQLTYMFTATISNQYTTINNTLSTASLPRRTR